MDEKFFIDVEERKICGVLHLPEKSKPACVITCHGLFSSKDSDKFTGIAERFTRESLAVIRFDFSGCGESSGHISDTTVSRRLQELEAVAAFAGNHQSLGRQQCLLGSSLGGYLSLLYALKHPGTILSLWATPYDLLEISENIPPSDLKQLKQEFFIDARTYSLASILGAVSHIQLIQGQKDSIVPWRHAEEIFFRANEPKELVILPEGDHSLTGAFEREKAVSKSLAWFLQHIST